MAMTWTVPPDTLQIDGVVEEYDTLRPDEAVAANVKSASRYDLAGMLGKVMVWRVLTVNERVTSGAAL
jgi:hypothetical protein